MLFNTKKAETIAGLGFRRFSADEGLYIRVFYLANRCVEAYDAS